VSIILLSSCDQASNHFVAERGAEEITPFAPPSLPLPNQEIRLETVSCEQWEKSLASHQGKIVVVDTWATWCLPCMEEFPELVRLQAKYANDGVACMSVSVDEPEQKASVQEFLSQHNADFSNYLIDDKGNALWDKWNIKGIPVVLVFDVDGKLAKKFDRDDPDNQFTYADVEKLVVELLTRN